MLKGTSTFTHSRHFVTKEKYKTITLETKLIITIKEVLPGFCIYKHITVLVSPLRTHDALDS
jgi:hypothetical protein